MITTCPTCTQSLEIDSETMVALRAVGHFECPACKGAVPLPRGVAAPKSTSGPRVVAPGAATRQGSPGASARTVVIGKAQQGLNRNLLILGSLVLLVLGGLGYFLASKMGGNVFNRTTNRTDQITNNSYFQQLITSGVTTKMDLEALAIIRPYGDGFIGVSRDELAWPQAVEVGRRAGGDVLEPANGGAEARETLLAWLEQNLAPQLAVPVWVQEGGRARILDGKEVLAVTGTGRERRVLVRWLSTSKGEPIGGGKPASYTADDPWRGFDPGPLVFDDSFTQARSLERANVIGGQYGADPTIVSGMGLRLSGGHTWGMAWPKAVLGSSCRIEFEVQGATKDAPVIWVVRGSGSGNSSDSGYSFTIQGGELVIRRNGYEWEKKKLPSPLNQNPWTAVQTDLRDRHLAVRLNGTLVAEVAAPEALSGALHAWFGMCGDATYRNVRIWSSEKNQSLEPQVVPPPGIPPRPNGEEIFTFSEPEGPLGARWKVQIPATAGEELNASDFVRVERGVLVFSPFGSNAWPLAMLLTPLAGSFAVEFTHQYPNLRSHNFAVILAKSPAPPDGISKTEETWQIVLPVAEGKHYLAWGLGSDCSTFDANSEQSFRGPLTVIATTAFHAPLSSRDYRFRIEYLRGDIRVFLGGNLLIEGKRRARTALSGSPVFLALSQAYHNSRISSLRIYRLADE